MSGDVRSALAAHPSRTELRRQWTDWRVGDGGAAELLPALLQEMRRSEFARARLETASGLRAAIGRRFK